VEVGAVELFGELAARGHEGLFFASDPDAGLRAVIGVHSTLLGPALGGTRIRDYRTLEEALTDVLRLSRAMTYTAAGAHLPLGGGKAVILADPATMKSEALLEAYGRAVDALGGTYVTAEDVGTTVEDMVVVARRTGHVSGLPFDMGGSGDPSPATAHGVLAAMRASAEHLWGVGDLEGRVVAVQGVGKVGSVLVELLVGAGCDVVVADVDEGAVAAAASRPGVRAVPAGEILSTPCDILAPCALGGVFGRDTIPALQCAAVVGAANNQLLDPEDGDRLAAAGILYTPDFIANAGGIINIAEEVGPQGYSLDRALRAVERIYDTTGVVLRRARSEGITPAAAAVAHAEDRLRAATTVRQPPQWLFGRDVGSPQDR
jgi:glutamate dehydrogenase/leucine dehydrogenase